MSKNNEEYYEKMVKGLQLNQSAMENTIKSLDDKLKNKEAQKAFVEAQRDNMENHLKEEITRRINKSQWLSLCLWVGLFVFLVLGLVLKAYSDKSAEYMSLLEEKSQVSETTKQLARADSIFHGIYCLYPTDTAVMYSTNGFGDTLKLMITNKR